jgi:hypothetical protein
LAEKAIAMLPIFNVKSVLAYALVFVPLGARTAIAATFTIFAPSGATQTDPQSINDSGAITGDYVSGGRNIGFLRAADGTFTSLANSRVRPLDERFAIYAVLQ